MQLFNPPLPPVPLQHWVAVEELDKLRREEPHLTGIARAVERHRRAMERMKDVETVSKQRRSAVMTLPSYAPAWLVA